MSSMQEQLVRRYQRLLRELATPAARTGTPGLRRRGDAPASVLHAERAASSRAKLRTLAESRFD